MTAQKRIFLCQWIGFIGGAVMKKAIGILMAALFALSALGAAPSALTVRFVDSVGRAVEIPRRIDRIAVSGALAQITLFALCPDKLVGVAEPWSETAKRYLAEEYHALPELGQVYGGKQMNLEALIESGAQIVVDVGEPKKDLADDFDQLQAQTRIPFVHVTATLSTMGDAYRMLGELLGMPEEAEALAAACEAIYAQTSALAAGLDKVGVLYLTGDQGLNVIARGSYHAEVIDLLADNRAALADPSSRGSGNEVDMEQILAWDPEVILFSPGSVYASVGGDPIWQNLRAIRDGRYYETPMGPYNWVGFPPSAQRCLGMMWLAQLLYPDDAQYDLYRAIADYFKLFYHCELTKAQYDELVANSIGKRRR
ncbi:MAG: ABC transporter substrate-binding protein [Clostridiales bacterium]|nr:ABC transporter substrate-binding protein [Clostridiales bacterium]